jgi:hypothetical protein
MYQDQSIMGHYTHFFHIVLIYGDKVLKNKATGHTAREQLEILQA